MSSMTIEPADFETIMAIARGRADRAEEQLNKAIEKRDQVIAANAHLTSIIMVQDEQIESMAARIDTLQADLRDARKNADLAAQAITKMEHIHTELATIPKKPQACSYQAPVTDLSALTRIETLLSTKQSTPQKISFRVVRNELNDIVRVIAEKN